MGLGGGVGDVIKNQTSPDFQRFASLITFIKTKTCLFQQDTQVRGIIIPCKASGTPDYIVQAKKMLEVFKSHLSTLESELLEPQPKRKKYR